jgi:hypothetical protein
MRIPRLRILNLRFDVIGTEFKIVPTEAHFRRIMVDCCRATPGALSEKTLQQFRGEKSARQKPYLEAAVGIQRYLGANLDRYCRSAGPT